MKFRHSTYDYPITMRQMDGMMVFSSPDLGNTVVIPLPENGRISPDFLMKVANSIGKMWIKNKSTIERKVQKKGALPSPSKLRLSIGERKQKPFTPVTLAKILGVSAETIRRAIDTGECPAERTSGGHRKIPFHVGLEFAQARGLRVEFID